MSDDSDLMGCDEYVDSISAMIDGEPPAIDERLVEQHLRRCPSCAEFRSASEQARRRLVVREAEVIPDVSRTVVSMAAVADRAGRLRIPLVLLLVVAIEVIVLSAIDLFTATGDPDVIHDARHLSAFTLAYGVLLLLVVARPARARTALPVAGVLAAALVITAIADLTAGRIPLAGEALHLPEVISVLLIWLLAVPVGRSRASQERPAPDRSTLTLVDEDTA